MFYLLLIILLMGTSCGMMLKVVSASLSANAEGSADANSGLEIGRISMPLLMGLAATLMSGPIFQTLVAINRADRGNEVRFDLADPAVSGPYGLYMMMAALPLLLLLAGSVIRRMALTRTGSFGTQGLAILLLACALETGMTLYSHYSFYRSSNDGIANLTFLKQEFGVTDIDCSAGTILIKRSGDGGITYRCPLSLAYLSFSTRPIIPWPDFKDGHSPKLIEAIRQIEAQAEANKQQQNETKQENQ